VAWVGLACLICWTFFVAINPFLWPDPAGRTAAMFEYRRDEMLIQQRNSPGEAVHGLADRANRVLRHALVKQTWANDALGVPLDVPFAAIGLTWLAAVARREWLRGRHVGPSLLFLLWGSTYLAGTVLGYLLDWNHYVMPVFLLAALTSGIGLSAALHWVFRPLACRVAPTFQSRHVEPAPEVSAAQPR
jgi:hypothetical protein